MNTVAPLPIVVPRLAGEALGSWLSRVGAVYDLDAHRLLDVWIGPTPKVPRQQRMSVETRLTPHQIPSVAHALRVLAGEIEPLPGSPKDWLLQSDTDIAVCPHCLIDDDQRGRVRHRRVGWTQAWRTTCETHRKPLIHLPEWATEDVRAWTYTSVSQRTALGRLALPPRRPSRNDASRSPISIAIDAVRQIESAVGSALAGRSPRRAEWGGLDAKAFLRVVRDVTSFVLTNFGDRLWAPICTTDLRRFTDPAPAPARCFARPRSYRLHAQGKPVDLVWAGNVGLRRCALFWTRELMHARTLRPWLEKVLKNDRIKRQTLILQRQTNEGLTWLANRMRNWPEEYQRHWWAGMRRLTHP